MYLLQSIDKAVIRLNIDDTIHRSIFCKIIIPKCLIQEVIMNSELKSMIQESNNIVFFGGAGVSTESGIPDFRSEDGLYRQKYKYSPEQVISHSFFMKYPEVFYEFYKDKMMCLEAKPNAAHNKLSELEKSGKLKAVVTQNIDGLHQKAGNKTVYELHGSIHRNYCMKCKKEI